jgi:hypothetical protein
MQNEKTIAASKWIVENYPHFLDRIAERDIHWIMELAYVLYEVEDEG